MTRTIVSFTAFAWLSVGCSSLIHEQKLSQTGGPPGISYFLPKRLHKVTYWITKGVKVTDPDYDDKYNTALTTLLEAAETKKSTDTDDAKKAATLAYTTELHAEENSPRSAQQLARATAEASIAKRAVVVSDTDYSTAQKALIEIGKLKMVTGSNDVCSVSMEFEPQPLVPDIAEKRIANIRHLYTRDDHLVITTTASGLLSGADATSVDRSGDILTAIAQAVMGLPIAKGDKAQTQGDTPLDRECTEGKYSEMVDLNTEIADFNSRLCERAPGFSLVNQTPPDGSTISTPKACPDGVLDIFNSACDGLAYRRELPCQMALIGPQGMQDVALITMPQGSPIAYVPYNVGMFVKNEFNVTFENGMLIKSEVDKPSELLSLVKLPVDMARGVMSVLTEFIQLRVNYVGDSTALIEGEAARKRALVEEKTAQIRTLIDYQKALIERAEADSDLPE